MMAWAVYGETLAPLAIAGMVLTALGVALVAGPSAPTTASARRSSGSDR